MSRSAEVCVAESYDGLVVILISGAVFVYLALILAVHAVRDGVCFGAQLYDAERSSCTGVGVSHAACAYHRIDVRCGRLVGGSVRSGMRSQCCR